MAAIAYPAPHRLPRAVSATRPRYGMRRLVAVLCLVALVFALHALFGLVSRLGGSTPLTAPGASLTTRPVAARVHVVQPGDTLWSIARSLEPKGDVRELVDRLAAERGDAALQVGERVVLP